MLAQGEFVFLFRLQEKMILQRITKSKAGLCNVGQLGESLHLYQTGSLSIPCPVSKKPGAASQAQPHPQNSCRPASSFHSTTNLENLTLIQTAFSIWAEVRTMHLSLQNCNCISNSTLQGVSFNTYLNK